MDNVKISKKLSLVLRHNPQKIGITLDEHGWADVKTLIRKFNEAFNADLDMEKLDEVVRTNDKQRYSFNEDKTKIRANQGHSINVDVELKPTVPPEILYHGTSWRFVGSIQKNGILKMNRLYVHLSPDEETALKVGKRHGSPVIFKVLSGDMHKAGCVFYLSENNVWLTDSVPPQYIEII
ncbi:MAG: RNA 2'-phosphotransferase [Acutalibacteraceae bacterium]|nr:RNA 2'-phosphotransferase [Clostridia bacterium]MEE3449309.1 RNA 2'-phosphotransferase [Acutalibacteraceae bacterium]